MKGAPGLLNYFITEPPAKICLTPLDTGVYAR